MSCNSNSAFNFSVKQGSSKQVGLQLYKDAELDSEGNLKDKEPADISGSNILIEFKRKNNYSADAVITLSTDPAIGGVVVTDGTQGQFYFELLPEHTSSISVFKLGYDVRVELRGNPNNVAYVLEGTLTIDKTYTEPPELTPPQYSNNGYVLFDAGSRMFFLDSSPISKVLDWRESFSFGFVVASDWTAGPEVTIISNGSNEIRMRKENAKINLRVFANGQVEGAGVHFETDQFSAGDRIVFTYDSSSEDLKLYRNSNEIVNVSISGYVDGSNGQVEISSSVSPFSLDPAVPYELIEGGMDDLFFVCRPLSLFEVGEIPFSSDPSVWSFYSDLVDFMLMGEDPVPQIKGLKQVLEGRVQPPNPSLFQTY